MLLQLSFLLMKRYTVQIKRASTPVKSAPKWYTLLQFQLGAD